MSVDEKFSTSNGIRVIASLDNLLSINTLGIYMYFRDKGQFQSYRRPQVPSCWDKRGSTVLLMYISFHAMY